MKNEITTKVNYTQEEIDCISLLEVSQQPFIIAMTADRISAMMKQEAVMFIFEQLNLRLIECGLGKENSNDVSLLSISTYDVICEHYKTLTTHQFIASTKNGVLNHYGEWYGFCLKSVNQWMRGYMNDEKHIRAVKDWNEKIKKTVVRTSDKVTIELASKKSCVAAFEEYKVSKKLPFGAFAYYDIICECLGVHIKDSLHKTVLPDANDRAYCVEKGKENYLNGCKIVGETIYNQIVQSVVAKHNRSFEFEIKKVALGLYFDKLIAQNKNLEL